MKIGNVELKGNIFLAPMAGYTNMVYREICSSMGASLVCGEMISAKGLLYENARTWDMLKCGNEAKLSFQLFGYDISDMVAAAKIFDKETNCDIIDINMACPMRKIVSNKSGSFLMTEIDHAKELVRCVVNSVSKPVTVKIRGGYDHSHINCVEFAKAMEEAGASAIIIHGRLRTDFYTGECNLDYIKSVKEAVNIPVIGSGDVTDRASLQRMLDYTGCDGVMIGRASRGNPWIFEDLCNYMEGKDYVYPSESEKIDFMISHYERLCELKGEMLATLEMRSLAAWYVKGFKHNREYKRALVTVKNKQEFLEIIDKHLR